MRARRPDSMGILLAQPSRRSAPARSPSASYLSAQPIYFFGQLLKQVEHAFQALMQVVDAQGNGSECLC